MRKSAVYYFNQFIIVPGPFPQKIQVNCCKRITFSKSYPFNAIHQNFLCSVCKLIRIKFLGFVAYTCIPPDKKNANSKIFHTNNHSNSSQKL